MKPPKELKQLSVLQPYKTVLAIAGDWIVIALAIAVSKYMQNVFVYLAAVAIIGGRMHGLGVIMHEAAHYRFMKNRKLADALGDIFTAWPVLITVQSYRNNHLAHHQHTNTDDDPDWRVKKGAPQFTFPQKIRMVVLQLGGYLIAVNTIRDLAQILPRVSRSDRSTRAYKLTRIAFYIVAALVFTYLGIWKSVLLYWIVPYLTVLFLFQHVRSVSEHFGSMDYSHELTSTRTVKPYFWERWFFAPHNINYHLEHHLFPGVPFYNLPKLHEALMRDPSYRAKAHITRGYSTGLVRECLSEPQQDASSMTA